MESIEIKEFWSKDGSSLLRSKFEVKSQHYPVSQSIKGFRDSLENKKAPFPAGRCLQAAFIIRFDVSN